MFTVSSFPLHQSGPQIDWSALKNEIEENDEDGIS
jgi:hypothetical protein